MEYKFIGEIFEEGKRLFIKVPFNVWEVCEKKGNIPAKVVINDFDYECKLIPKGNGTYYIPVTKTDYKNISASEELSISFEFISELSRINKNSPYSLENPIRKIDTIKVLEDTKEGLCGQGCIAMLSGEPFEKVSDLMGNKKGQCSMSKVIEALNYYGIAHSNKMIYTLKDGDKLPDCCIVNSKGHLMVFFKGNFYDSDKGILQDFELNKITGVLEIFL